MDVDDDFSLAKGHKDGLLDEMEVGHLVKIML